MLPWDNITKNVTQEEWDEAIKHHSGKIVWQHFPGSPSFYELVQNFYDVTGQVRPAVPTAITSERRARLMTYLLSEIVEFGNCGTLEEQVCESVDLLYFVMDIFVELGVDPDVPLRMIHEANMSKVWPDGQAHWDHSVVPSRLLKPEGWESAESKIKAYVKELLEI